MKTSATLALSAAGLILVMALGAGCSKGADPNGPGNKGEALKMKPSMGGPGGPGGSTGGGDKGPAASAGVKE